MRTSRVWRAAFVSVVIGGGLLLPTVPAQGATIEVPAIVVLRRGVDAEKVADAADVDVTAVFDEAISGFSADLSSAELTRLRRSPLVRNIVPITSAQVVPSSPVPTAPRHGLPIVKADDSTGLLSLVAGLQSTIDGLLRSLGLASPLPTQTIPTAMQRIGAPQSPTARIDGVDDRVGATIAVIDTGIDRHSDLNLVGGYDCAADKSGWDRDLYAPDRNGPGTGVLEGHGTLVAGVAAAIDNTSGVVGVAPGARLLSAKALTPKGFATNETIICALNWAIGQNVDVINLSVGWPIGWMGSTGDACGTDRDLIHEAICEAVRQGITVVAAAGNEGADAATSLPAAYPEVIAVSALADFDGLPGGTAPTPACGKHDKDDHLRVESNFGPLVDIAAVGMCVVTTGLNGSLTTSGGTSLSAPAVAGAAALLRSQDRSLTPAQVRSRLLADAEPGPWEGDPINNPVNDEGLLNVRSL